MIINKLSFLIVLAILVTACAVPEIPAITKTPVPAAVTPQLGREVCARSSAQGALNLHQGAALRSQVIGHLEENDLVRVISKTDSDWWLVATSAQSGYARSTYLKIVKCESEEK